MGLTTANNIKEATSARNGGDTQISSRNDIFDQDMVDEEQTKEESARMDALMRKLLGGGEDEEEDEMDVTVTQESAEETTNDSNEENDAFSFKLFSSAPLAEVNIKSTADDTANDMSKAVADQQIVEFDDTDPEFLSRVKQAALEFDTIMQQSQIPYPAMRFSRRVVHILENGEPVAKKDGAIQDKNNKKKRKSKKYRDFQKAVAENKMIVKPNMRNPQTPDGWPGWPGHRTKVAIIQTDVVQTAWKKTGYGRGGHSRGGFSRGSSRGGGFRGRGRGRGRGF